MKIIETDDVKPFLDTYTYIENNSISFFSVLESFMTEFSPLVISKLKTERQKTQLKNLCNKYGYEYDSRK